MNSLIFQLSKQTAPARMKDCGGLLPIFQVLLSPCL